LRNACSRRLHPQKVATVSGVFIWARNGKTFSCVGSHLPNRWRVRARAHEQPQRRPMTIPPFGGLRGKRQIEKMRRPRRPAPIGRLGNRSIARGAGIRPKAQMRRCSSDPKANGRRSGALGDRRPMVERAVHSAHVHPQALLPHSSFMRERFAALGHAHLSTT
jgi:hypothetical protein